MVDHNRQRKVAVINDYSGFGRCSVAVSMPIISTMKIQCCPVPTSIFSNHTGFPSFFFDDYTDRMQAYIDNWKKLGLEFEGITSGFLGSERQIAIVQQFIREFRTDRTTVVIDPVMADNGSYYSKIDDRMCAAFRRLLSRADVITPNVTEAALLAGLPYEPGTHGDAYLAQLFQALGAVGAGVVTVTGVRPQPDVIGNVASLLLSLVACSANAIALVTSECPSGVCGAAYAIRPVLEMYRLI